MLCDKPLSHPKFFSLILYAYHPQKSTLPYSGLQHMQQFQVRLALSFALPMLSIKWCLINSPTSGDLNPRPSSRESSALTTTLQLLCNEKNLENMKTLSDGFIKNP